MSVRLVLPRAIWPIRLVRYVVAFTRTRCSVVSLVSSCFQLGLTGCYIGFAFRYLTHPFIRHLPCGGYPYKPVESRVNSNVVLISVSLYRLDRNQTTGSVFDPVRSSRRIRARLEVHNFVYRAFLLSSSKLTLVDRTVFSQTAGGFGQLKQQ